MFQQVKEGTLFDQRSNYQLFGTEITLIWIIIDYLSEP
jgi:hypothetical protein